MKLPQINGNGSRIASIKMLITVMETCQKSSIKIPRIRGFQNMIHQFKICR
jgi:hypothetical protein